MAKITFEIPIDEVSVWNASTENIYDVNSDTPEDYKCDDYIRISEKTLLEALDYKIDEGTLSEQFYNKLMKLCSKNEGFNEIIAKIALKYMVRVTEGKDRAIMRLAKDTWEELCRECW